MGKAGRLSNKGYIPLCDVPAMVYEMTGVRRNARTVYNWTRIGRNDKHGCNIKLRASKRLSVQYTRREWLDEFIEAVG